MELLEEGAVEGFGFVEVVGLRFDLFAGELCEELAELCVFGCGVEVCLDVRVGRGAARAGGSVLDGAAQVSCGDSDS